MAVVVAKLSADGPVSMFLYLLLIRKYHSLIKPGELQFHTGSLLQRTISRSMNGLIHRQGDGPVVRDLLYLVGIGTGNSDGIEEVLEAVRHRPKTESHFT